jgi:hypothetical protein
MMIETGCLVHRARERGGWMGMLIRSLQITKPSLTVRGSQLTVLILPSCPEKPFKPPSNQSKNILMVVFLSLSMHQSNSMMSFKLSTLLLTRKSKKSTQQSRICRPKDIPLGALPSRIACCYSALNQELTLLLIIYHLNQSFHLH